MGIHLENRTGNPHFDEGNPPPPDPEGAEVREEGRRTIRGEKAGNLLSGVPENQEKRDAFPGKLLGGFTEPAQQEVVGPMRRVQKGGGEAEDNAERPFPCKGLGLGEKKRPVVLGTHVAGHPVENRTSSVAAFPQLIDPGEVHRFKTGHTAS